VLQIVNPVRECALLKLANQGSIYSGFGEMAEWLKAAVC
jgi:hypothetical protein